MTTAVDTQGIEISGLSAGYGGVAVVRDLDMTVRPGEVLAALGAADLAADGVVYAEVRFAPELHQQQGLALAIGQLTECT